MNKSYKVFLIIAFIFSSFLYASAGNKKVKLLGNKNNNAPKYITPKYLDENFKTVGIYLYNPWEKRKDHYEGVLLDEFIMKLANKDVKQLVSKAIDDYAVTFDKKLWNSKRILLVNKVNGKYISIRQKGPLRFVFMDYDESKDKNEYHLSKWMWLVKSLEFK